MTYRDPAAERAYHRQWRAQPRVREWDREYTRQWRTKNPDKAAALKQTPQYKAYAREYSRRYRAEHPEKIRSDNQQYHSEHRDKRTAGMRLRYSRDPEPNRDRSKKWRRANPELKTAQDNRRRVRLMGAEGRHTVQEWRDKKTLFANCCAYCGESRPLERDHKTPLIRGGSDYIGNIVPACRSCNSRKRHRTVQEFFAA